MLNNHISIPSVCFSGDSCLHLGLRGISSVVEPEPERECLTVPEPDLDPGPTLNGIKKVKNSKMRGQLSGK
jgi:hypothetical protein